MDWNFKTKPTFINQAATGLALVMLTLGPAAYAQGGEPVETTSAETDTDGDEEMGLDVVRVTGIRSAIETSLQAKKDSTSIIEAITAEDIGKLPDVSIADSLARLPGVTAQRVRGRSQQISIRGLGPDFSLALLNGREIVSSGNNRGVEFDQFPSELIAQGIVYKTPDARLAATGIAGAVDLRTIKPLDFGDRQLNLSAKYVVNDNGQLNPDFNDDGYRFFGSYIDQTEDGSLGWYLGATVQSNPTQFTSRELKTNSGQTTVDADTGLVIPIDNPRTGVVSREFERTSIAGALQFEPNDKVATTLDAFYTDTEDAGIFRGVETPIASWAGVTPTDIQGTSGFADQATYPGTPPVLRTDTESATAEIFAIGSNTRFQVTDTLAFTLDISHSTLDRNDIDYESYGALASGLVGSGVNDLTDNLTIRFDDDGEYVLQPSQDYTNPDTLFLIDPGGWGQVGFINEPEVEDELSQLRLEAEKDLEVPFISGLVGGALYTERRKQFELGRTFIRSNDTWFAGPNGNLVNDIPDNLVVGVTDDGGTGFPILAYDPASLLTDGTYTLDPVQGPAWVVNEEIVTLYAMANIDDEVGGIPVRGNVGFQFVDTTQASTGTLAGVGTQTVEETYDNFLPSANLAFEVMPDTFVRLGAAQTITRARLDQLEASQNIFFNPQVCSDENGDGAPDTVGDETFDPQNGTTCFGLGGGNPALQPYKSTSFDVSFERYFGEASAVSLAIFHKELEDWVVGSSAIVDVSQQAEAAGFGGILETNPEFSQGIIGGPVNLGDGTITGVEATARLGFDPFLPENLAGFGVNASYTYADNEVTNELGEPQDIPGYSDTTWSAELYYENYGFRARVIGRYQSEFLSEVRNFSNTLENAFAEEEFTVDAQIGYEWFEGPLEGFSVNFEAYNLTDEAFSTIEQTAGDGVSFPSRNELYGTTYNITVAKTF